MGFSRLRASVKAGAKKTMVIAWGLDTGVLQAAREALDQKFLAKVIVTGPVKELKELMRRGQINSTDFTFVEATQPDVGARLAVQRIKEKQADLLMKGHLNTSILLRAVLNKENGIRAQALLSHIAIIELPGPRLCLLTDPGMNIKPDLKQKSQILDNAIQFAWSLGLENPKVAVLASLETVNPQMPDTIEAAALTLMGQRGQFSQPAIVDGPLAFDNAYSLAAAKQKGIQSEVAGQADIFMVPELTAGNILYKAFGYVGEFKTAGIIYGASCPIVLTSRADNAESKLNTIVVACQALLDT